VCEFRASKGGGLHVSKTVPAPVFAGGTTWIEKLALDDGSPFDHDLVSSGAMLSARYSKHLAFPAGKDRKQRDSPT